MNTNDFLQNQGTATSIPTSSLLPHNSQYTTSDISNLHSINTIPSTNEALRNSLSSSGSSTVLENTLNGSSFLNGEPSDSRPHLHSEERKSSDETTASFVQLARRRRSSKSKEKQHQHRKNSVMTRPQGRPLSKETRIRLTLVPTLGILYSILVSDTMRKTLKVLKYSNEQHSINLTNEELSTRNVISGFSSLLNVRTARFSEDGISYSPDKNTTIPKFATIDEAVYNLFGLNDYTLIRVSRAAATEIGGSVLLKIETAMPGYLYLNDDEDEDFETVEKNKEIYLDAIGHKGDSPTTTFLKKKVARPRYKSDMRIYLIPRINSCAIYCEKRMFKRDLLRGFLNMNKLDRSIIVAFNYDEAIEELEKEGYGELLKEMKLPTVEQFHTAAPLPQDYPVTTPVELSISKQSALQHLQHMQHQQQQQQHHQQNLVQPGFHAPGQPQSQYYTGYSRQGLGSDSIQQYYDPQQQQQQPQMGYGFSQPAPQMYQVTGQQQHQGLAQAPSIQHGSSFQQFNSYPYGQELDSSTPRVPVSGYGNLEQQFIQQQADEIVGNDSTRRVNNQFSQQPFYNPYASQVINQYSTTGQIPPQQQPFLNNSQFIQTQDPSTHFAQQQ